MPQQHLNNFNNPNRFQKFPNQTAREAQHSATRDGCIRLLAGKHSMISAARDGGVQLQAGKKSALSEWDCSAQHERPSIARPEMAASQCWPGSRAQHERPSIARPEMAASECWPESRAPRVKHSCALPERDCFARNPRGPALRGP